MRVQSSAAIPECQAAAAGTASWFPESRESIEKNAMAKVSWTIGAAVAMMVMAGCSTMAPIPEKRFAQIEDGRLEYAASGEGRPTVVFINGGGPATMDSWAKVYPDAAKISSVFAYNRFGDGRSDQVSEPQTGEKVVGSLRRLLQKEGQKPPYILVGHSLGGLYANLFARRYPREVAGVVLVDSSHPDQGEMMRSQRGMLGAVNHVFQWLYRKHNPTKASEIDVFDETASQVREAGAFPDVPVIVISAGKRPSLLVGAETLALIERHQNELAQLSPKGRRVVAEQSGHYVQDSEPGIVVDAIRGLVDQARTR
jgi:pimeloyl-ACP methyl ester carboxylesterase